MTEADKLQVAHDVLKSFNSAVTTTKLYPSSSPQVTAAEENGFKQISAFVERYKVISFCLNEDEPTICGFPVNQKSLGKVTGHEVYQQLRLLEMNHLVLDKRLDRNLYRQLLVFFISSPQLINREGGGRSFAANLGLLDFFPLDYEMDVPEVQEDHFALLLQRLLEEKRVRTENILSLTQKIDTSTEAGKKKCALLAGLTDDREKIVDLVAASIAQCLKGVERVGEITFPKSFSVTLANLDIVVARDATEKLAIACAAFFVANLNDFALHTLLLREFPSRFGRLLYGSLVKALAVRLDGVVELFEEEKKVLKANAGTGSSQYRSVVRAVDAFFETDRGKQYRVREKAKKNLQQGEKDRQTKRIQAGVSALLKGDSSRLQNKEIVDHLPATVSSLVSHGKDKVAAQIIEKIAREIAKGGGKTDSMLIKCLTLIGQRLVDNEKWGWLEKLSIPLMAWLKEVQDADEVFENTVEILNYLQNYYWEHKKGEKADRILALFFAIRTGKLKKNDEIVSLVGKVQDLSIERPVLVALLQECVEEENDLLDRRLVMLGPLSVRFLLQVLLTSEEKPVRLKVLALLGYMGPLLPPLLIEKLHEPMPWFAKRNLLKLLAASGSEKDILVVADYLNHEDIRVQKEAFACIEKLSGEERKTNLLEALSLATGAMKEQVVRALIPLVDSVVVGEIIALAEDWKLFQEETRDGLLLQIFNLLSRTSQNEAAEFIQNFLDFEKRKEARGVAPRVWQAARDSLRQVRLQQRSSREKSGYGYPDPSEGDAVEKVADEEVGERPLITDYDEEVRIRKELDNGNVDKARELLVELIEKVSSVQNFVQAEQLRNWLIETDATALQDIIKSAEIIDRYKSEGISDDYLQVWSSLQDQLSTEEFNALYYAMEHYTLAGEEVLVRQGDDRPTLFFVNHGKVKIYFNDKNREVFVKNYRSGEVFGCETFFDSTFWTMSAAALERSQISALPLGNTENWKDDHPSLQSKLQEFCNRHQGVAEDIRAQQQSRRQYDRTRIGGDVLVEVLEKDGRETGVKMKGELADVSLGGFSFLIRISRKKNARIMLGRPIKIQIPSKRENGGLLKTDGFFISIRSLYSMNNEYSAHVCFSEVLAKEDLKGVLDACRN